MSKYKVIKEFTDVQAKRVRKIGDEIELTEERFAELEENLLTFGGGYLESSEEVAVAEPVIEETSEPAKEEAPKKETAKKTSKSK